MQEKHDQLMAWIDLPFDQRPQLLMGKLHAIYFKRASKFGP